MPGFIGGLPKEGRPAAGPKPGFKGTDAGDGAFGGKDGKDGFETVGFGPGTGETDMGFKGIAGRGFCGSSEGFNGAFAGGNGGLVVGNRGLTGNDDPGAEIVGVNVSLREGGVMSLGGRSLKIEGFCGCWTDFDGTVGTDGREGKSGLSGIVDGAESFCETCFGGTTIVGLDGAVGIDAPGLTAGGCFLRISKVVELDFAPPISDDLDCFSSKPILLF